MTEFASHPGLLRVLERARHLGFTGPGEPADHIDHALRFVAVLGAHLQDLGESRHDQASWPVAGEDQTAENQTAEVMPLIGFDLGSGAGLPGLVLALGFPRSTWTLVESMLRRARVLVEAVDELQLAGRVDVETQRAELVGQSPTCRNTADVVVARSFGPPAVAAECAAPLLRIGGVLLVSEPPSSQGDRWPPTTLGELGLSPGGVEEGIMVIRKVGPTPERFPRRVGIPTKRPLFPSE